MRKIEGCFENALPWNLQWVMQVSLLHVPPEGSAQHRDTSNLTLSACNGLNVYTVVGI